MKFLIALIALVSLIAQAQYVDFSTKAAGDQITNAELNSTFVVIKNHQEKARVRAYVSQQLAFPNNRPTAGWELAPLVFHTETKDETNAYNPSNGEFTASRDMRLKVNIDLWSQSGTGVAFIKAQIFRSGAWHDDVYGTVYHNAGDRLGASLSSQISLNAGEKLRFMLYMTSYPQVMELGSPARNNLKITEL